MSVLQARYRVCEPYIIICLLHSLSMLQRRHPLLAICPPAFTKRRSPQALPVKDYLQCDHNGLELQLISDSAG